MRKSPFAKIIWICCLVFTTGAILFISLILCFQPEPVIIGVSLGFVAFVAMLLTGLVLAMRSEMLGILKELSEFIQSLMNGRKVECHTDSEDHLLSKLQGQIVQLSDLLSAQRQRYREESHEVKALISDISHQLKTPLANLSMYSSLLEDQGLPPDKRKEFTLHLSNQIAKLSWLMESLIKLSRLETGIIELKMDYHNMENTVLAAIKQAFPAAQRKKIQIRLEGGQGLWLRHDPKWTGEAIFNVIDNAVKYTAENGDIIITVRKYDFFARIDVADNGWGIPEQEHNAIFQRFFRGEQARANEGVGIGLYLTRKIVTEQGGYMKVASSLGEGSIFSIFMPLQM